MENEVELAKQYLGESENEIVTPVNDYDAVSDDFTIDEIEEFKKLNGIKDATIDSVADNTQEEHVVENIVTEQPTETKVTSVKVSKQKNAKETKKDNIKKEVKSRTPKKNKK